MDEEFTTVEIRASSHRITLKRNSTKENSSGKRRKRIKKMEEKRRIRVGVLLQFVVVIVLSSIPFNNFLELVRARIVFCRVA